MASLSCILDLLVIFIDGCLQFHDLLVACSQTNHRHVVKLHNVFAACPSMIAGIPTSLFSADLPRLQTSTAANSQVHRISSGASSAFEDLPRWTRPTTCPWHHRSWEARTTPLCDGQQRWDQFFWALRLQPSNKMNGWQSIGIYQSNLQYYRCCSTAKETSNNTVKPVQESTECCIVRQSPGETRCSNEPLTCLQQS